MVATTLINKLGNEQQKETLLPSIASGELAVLAADESGHYNLDELATEARASDGGFIISGSKRGVIDGHHADVLLVVCKSESGLGVFAIPSDSDGISIETRLIVDSQRRADITLTDVAVGADALLGARRC